MRFIGKDKITQVFFNANISPLRRYVNKQLSAKPDPLHPNYALDRIIREALVSQLLIEQKGLCCYCMQRIEVEKEDFHIEHLAPQSSFKNEEVNYYNLFLSCGSPKISKKHCGHFKADYLIPKVVSFFNERSGTRCQDYFKYTITGEILPKDGCGSMEKNYTNYKNLNIQTKILISVIDALNLNALSLKETRKSISESIFSLPDDLDALNIQLNNLNVFDPETGYFISMSEVSKYFLEEKIKKISAT